jgi:hypothetical protein
VNAPHPVLKSDFNPDTLHFKLDHILLMARRHCEAVPFVPKADISLESPYRVRILRAALRFAVSPGVAEADARLVRGRSRSAQF